jgi:hypothetical protein
MIDKTIDIAPNFAVLQKTEIFFRRRKMILQEIFKQDFIVEVKNFSEIREGSFILIKGAGELHSARLVMHKGKALIVENVIDLIEGNFVAEQAVLQSASGEAIYRVVSDYSDEDDAHSVSAILARSALFHRYPYLHRTLADFVKAAWPPKLVLFLDRIDSLKSIFVPIQQRFRIGRFSVDQKWDHANARHFREMLERLIPNEYITYMGYIPQGRNCSPVFFSEGTATHLETDMKLKKEPFLYTSNCGGNIKLQKDDAGEKIFLVDAGSSYKGNGVNALIEDASWVSDYLRSLYPEFRFIPVSGRGAVGSKNIF